MTPAHTYSPKAAANYVLAMLVLAYILSFIDRSILALRAGPIDDEYSLTDHIAWLGVYCVLYFWGPAHRRIAYFADFVCRGDNVLHYSLAPRRPPPSFSA